ncbi:MAG: hypothetical protein IJV40_07620 [Oscillospiraceae bacterium]|nr:hypothetical protein [Oscillospiraceae bacterium]
MEEAAAHTETGWQDELGALNEFVRSNPEIRITPQSMRIPKPCREEFYARVDAVVEKLAGALAQKRLEEASEIAGRIVEVRNRICERSNLKQYRLPASIENLVENPVKAVSGPLFELVLDSVQNGRSGEEIEDRAQQLLFPFLKDLQRCAYEAWAYLTVIDAWKPIRFYGIVTTDFAKLTVAETDEAIVGYQFSSPDKRLPETVFETEDGKTVAVKTETGLELDYYGEKVSREKGYSSGGNTVNELAHRVLLAYRFPSPQEVTLIADAEKRFVKPTDLTCTFLLPSEMENEYLFSSFVRHIRTVRSLRPVQVLSFDENGAFPEEWAADPRIPGWERTAVGNDPEPLRRIAEKAFVIRKQEV